MYVLLIYHHKMATKWIHGDLSIRIIFDTCRIQTSILDVRKMWPKKRVLTINLTSLSIIDIYWHILTCNHHILKNTDIVWSLACFFPSFFGANTVENHRWGSAPGNKVQSSYWNFSKSGMPLPKSRISWKKKRQFPWLIYIWYIYGTYIHICTYMLSIWIIYG